MFPLKISYPLKDRHITQPFGVNYIYKGFYKKVGIPSDKHNGQDWRAKEGTPCYAVCNGYAEAKVGTTAGIYIKLWTDEFEADGKKVKALFRYLHLSRTLIRAGKVSQGQIIGLTGKTGNVTCPHLHFDEFDYTLDNGVWKKDYSNGYNGAVNPEPSFGVNHKLFPVDNRYGKNFHWLKEFIVRFKTPAVHRALIKRGRDALGLRNRELNALVYGGYTIEDILNPAMWITWTRETKSFMKISLC